MTIYGYARVSTTDQNNDIQREQLKQAGATNIIEEIASGKDVVSRSKLDLLVEMLSKSDTLIVTKLDRLSRSTVDTLNLINELNERGVIFKALDIQLDTTTPTGKFAVTVMAAVAELERTRIRERQAEGIAKAKKKGKYKGRQSSYEKHIPVVRNLLEMGKGGTYIAQTLNISRSTFYKIKREIDLDGQTAMDI